MYICIYFWKMSKYIIKPSQPDLKVLGWLCSLTCGQGRIQDFEKVSAGAKRPKKNFAPRCETASHPPLSSHSSLIGPASTLSLGWSGVLPTPPAGGCETKGGCKEHTLNTPRCMGFFCWAWFQTYYEYNAQSHTYENNSYLEISSNRSSSKIKNKETW